MTWPRSMPNSSSTPCSTELSGPREAAGPECEPNAQTLHRVMRSVPELDELRALLTADRAGTTARIAALSRDLEAIVEAARLIATDDEHDPEGATIAFERSQTNALLVDARGHLADLDNALTRIDAGDYGTCERCGGPIAVDRLQARPTARTCITCAA